MLHCCRPKTENAAPLKFTYLEIQSIYETVHTHGTSAQSWKSSLPSSANRADAPAAMATSHMSTTLLCPHWHTLQHPPLQQFRL